MTIPTPIEREVRRVHADGKYENLLIDLLDAYTSPGALRSLLQALNSSPALVAELELASQAADRSHTLHIGQRSRPSWERFNRALPDFARVDELQKNGSLLFWNVQLSRVGPFWTSYWNNFVLENGKPTPKLLTDPPGFEWGLIQ